MLTARAMPTGPAGRPGTRRLPVRGVMSFPAGTAAFASGREAAGHLVAAVGFRVWLVDSSCQAEFGTLHPAATAAL